MFNLLHLPFFGIFKRLLEFSSGAADATATSLHHLQLTFNWVGGHTVEHLDNQINTTREDYRGQGMCLHEWWSSPLCLDYQPASQPAIHCFIIISPKSLNTNPTRGGWGSLNGHISIFDWLTRNANTTANKLLPIVVPNESNCATWLRLPWVEEESLSIVRSHRTTRRRPLMMMIDSE